MEEKPPSRCSVAELAGRFKGSAPSDGAAGNQTEKPVRRRPPRSLHIPKPQGDEQEPLGVTSPVPKAKRNSALIEKLQANLALSPTAMLHSPKSPGFQLVPPSFTPPPPPSSPLTVAPVTEEEGPVSFEDPLTAAEGSILSSINKGRARHSLRRRPPSRRHRMSSSGDELGLVSDVAESTLTSEGEAQQEKTTAGGGGEREGGREEGGGEREGGREEGGREEEGGGEREGGGEKEGGREEEKGGEKEGGGEEEGRGEVLKQKGKKEGEQAEDEKTKEQEEVTDVSARSFSSKMNE